MMVSTVSIGQFNPFKWAYFRFVNSLKFTYRSMIHVFSAPMSLSSSLLEISGDGLLRTQNHKIGPQSRTKPFQRIQALSKMNSSEHDSCDRTTLWRPESCSIPCHDGSEKVLLRVVLICFHHQKWLYSGYISYILVISYHPWGWSLATEKKVTVESCERSHPTWFFRDSSGMDDHTPCIKSSLVFFPYIHDISTIVPRWYKKCVTMIYRMVIWVWINTY